jgi:DNA-binding NtrC family response regulator
MQSPGTLISFVDYLDPYAQSLIGDEEQPGPILSLLAARPFERLILFHTPHTADNANRTAAVLQGKVEVRLVPLPAPNPKDFSRLLGLIGPHLSGLPANLWVCSSSGTAEMRALWLLLVSSHQLRARVLQVKPPGYATGDSAQVTEVELDNSTWILSDPYIERSLKSASALPGQFAPRAESAFPPVPAAAASPRDLEPLPDGLDDALEELEIFIGSAVLRQAAERAAMLAIHDVPILVRGETGTGKEMFARLIHRLSRRQRRPLVAVNCAAIPSELFESALFGHEKGSFSSAFASFRGKFDDANGATLFLDELGELPLSAQAKLLRVVDNGIVQPIGGKEHKVDVRLVAATNRNLEEDIQQGRFRADLYYRLQVAEIHLPPLRTRRAEIPRLCLQLLERFNRTIGLRPRRLTQAALARLEQHTWPGNVRELSNLVQRSILLSRKELLDADDLAFDSVQARFDPWGALPDPATGFQLDDFLARARTHMMLRALDLSGGNQSKAAELLGVTKQAVSQFVKNRGVNPD